MASKSSSNNARIQAAVRNRSKDSSSPDRCPICLTAPDNKALTDACFHAFCFSCLKEWSKVKPECPLCKTVFRSILYNIRGNDDYDQFYLPPPVGPRFAGEDMFSFHQSLRNADSFFAHFMTSHEWRPRDQLQQENINAALVASTNIEIIRRRRLYYRRGHRVTHVNNNNKSRDISSTFFRHNPSQVHRLAPWIRRELIILYGANNMGVIRRVRDVIIDGVKNFGITSTDFYDALHPYLRDKTDHFISEFTAFARSPHDIATYDRNTRYAQPGRPSDPEYQAHEGNLSSLDGYYSYDSFGQRSMAVEAPLVQTSHSDVFSSDWSHRLHRLLARSRMMRSHPLRQHARLPPPPPVPPTNVPDEIIEITSSPESSQQSEDADTPSEHNSSIKVDDDDDDDDDDGDDVMFVSYTKPLNKRTPEAFIDLSSDEEQDRDKAPGPSGLSAPVAKWSSSSSSSASSLSDDSEPHSLCIKSVVVPVITSNCTETNATKKLCKVKEVKRSSRNLLSKRFADRKRLERSDSDSEPNACWYQNKKRRKKMHRKGSPSRK